MHPTVLFILAGYPGVGKSTLLAHALKNRLPLFGREHDAQFQTTKLPPDMQEQDVDAAGKLASGTWLHENHVGFLAMQRELPPSAVIHLDLYSVLLLTRHISGLPPKFANYVQRRVENYANKEIVRSLFRAFLSTPLFRRYDRIIVNTYQAPWDLIAAQWRAREEKQRLAEKYQHIRFLRDELFGEKLQGRAIHEAIYEGWAQALPMIKPYSELMTDAETGDVMVKQ